MKKTIKLKESDIERILINLQEEIGKPGETLDLSKLPDDYEIDVMEPTDEVPPTEKGTTGIQLELTLGKDHKTGEYFIFKDIDTIEPKIVARGIY